MEWVKTGRFFSKPIILFTLLSVTVGWGQVKFFAKPERTTVSIRDEFDVSFEVNADGDNFTPPSFADFTVISGPSQSISSSWINGKTTYSKRYTYTLAPRKIGVFRIGQASITIDGQVYKSLSVSITVKKGVAGSSSGSDISSDLILEVTPSKSTIYLNEPIELTYKIYVSSRVAISDFRKTSPPGYGDFWVQPIDVPEFKMVPDTYKGKSYNSIEIKRDVVFPQTSGNLTISPLVLNVQVDVPTNKRDFFGRRMYRSQHKNITANTLKINVLPLPDKGKPRSFKGAVGQFVFDVRLNKSSLNVGESIEAVMAVQGTGNFKLFELPSVTLSESLETYDPEHQEDINTISKGLIGSVSDKYLIVPLNPGTYKFPETEFSYFDPVRKKYITQTSTSHSFVVSGKALVQKEGTDGTSSQKNMIDSKAHFNFIKLQTKFRAIQSPQFFGSKLYYAFLFTPLALLVAFFIFVGQSGKGKRLISSGAAQSRLTRKFLKEAKKNIDYPERFHISLDKALINFLKHKLKIQISDMSKENLKQLLLNQGVSQENVEGIIKLKEKCEYAKYAPSEAKAILEDYDAAEILISKLNKELHA